AKVEAARGDLSGAIRRLRGVVERLPLPQYVVALGETELAAGRPVAARRDLALVGVEGRLLARGGVNTDVELARFEADHGSPARAVTRARRAWAGAPSVRSADALGWAHARAGEPAAGVRWAHRALRLGSRGPLLPYHGRLVSRGAGQGHLPPPRAGSGKGASPPAPAGGWRARSPRIPGSHRSTRGVRRGRWRGSGDEPPR